MLYPIKDIDGNILEHVKVEDAMVVLDGIFIVLENGASLTVSVEAYEYLLEYNGELNK